MTQFDDRLAIWQAAFVDEQPVWAQDEAIKRTVRASDYVARQLQRYPAVYELIAGAHHWADYDFSAAWQSWWADYDDDEAALMRALRQFKHAHQSALVHAVVNQQLPQSDFLNAISALAATLTEAALDFQHQCLVARYGEPRDSEGDPFTLSVLAMGKFGGGELNFSSDIDLIFAFRTAGETDGGERGKPIEHEQFFRKLAQKTIYLLDSVTEDGMVYRVDMRLRPFGQSGPLALSYDAIEQYYLLHGRDWERYAMMKARPVAGDIAGGAQLLNNLRPFMYRRYLDYAALRAISDMKAEINRHIRDEGLERHIKLGKGGIREAEFSVQAMQLVYGGQYPRLQQTHFLAVLEDLVSLDLWGSEEASALRKAYLFLREVENALQFDHEQQTHQLPDNESAWRRLVLAVGAEDVAHLQVRLEEARMVVHQQFKGIFAEDEHEANVDDVLQGIDWREPDEERVRTWLADHGVRAEQSVKMFVALEDLGERLPWQRLPKRTLSDLDRLLPQIVALASAPSRQKGLSGVLDLVLAVSGRGVYIDLLSDQSRLIEHLLDIAANSAWLMRFICEHPLVLDDVLSERPAVSDPKQLADDLAARLENSDDDEQWLHALRDFKHAQLFKVAWADVHGRLSLMEVSDYLSLIATLVLESAYQRAHQTMVARYGEPRGLNGEQAAFAIIGYGKLGGLELGYGSDLDLLFLYDQHGSGGVSDGEKSISNEQFFSRLVQRLNNYLSAPSASGVLYEVDTRLRPGGKSGLLVSSIQAFAQYQNEQAWTWEHQALTRTRFICGDQVLNEAFAKVRHDTLTRQRDEGLREEVVKMRQKMRDNHSQEAGIFHLKQSPGGLIDIEFIVQYLLLKHAHQEPVIARMSDNIRQLAALEATGIIPSTTAMTLRDAYRTLRGEAHRQYLNDSNSAVDENDWVAIRQRVSDVWQAVMCD
ncbi:bifunctional [glutamate--ammonia ligase]-adenylyl-L-tyrosine phosphorylase/[glutamate--ammonia-ligase] adenylyltransferase [Suttonella sp. R2A3]|uniref:bifunctional [glutamate--ammonia ligase]-adenylyl-L-tyrosine phosphorylase/[glutamate--ammonia-ligase] adenylyltransferase n=1 Tax=Suttonella sp. R2A3 TaxID=2908648 RepID=UPI001F1CED77|nr:bifunctional [glutamate--ammonia ligase]-adenylyl-L-tyrosine phosphorylase/[glutamate--ammonia-ligase] adenylyltransferase [Suttonella sp. R2A3]UJF25370.1 bifunctional [glutamate--ammonia ligase]-adenylyl-L-tyrosine phosphorylase/[glutamate--ammonia-ligase] adenylyltransferase [Suttonella sp. R2A3]